MKRKAVKSLFCAALMSLTLSMTACGGSGNVTKEETPVEEEASVEEETPEEEVPVEEETPEEEETPVEEEAPEEEEAEAEEETPAEEAGSGQMTLEEYMFTDPTTEQQLKDQAAAQANDQMDMDIEVKGNDIICVATFKDSVELPDDVSEQLSAGMDAVEPALSAIAGMLDDEIGAEKGTVAYVIRYCASDGTVLAEGSFRAE